MDLLVTRYRYPVNGAAGLVGNLIAESGVLPNRIEGSHSATPMRAPDFTGRVRDWTPDEVRDRSYSRRTGPRHPGIGLAQWTSPDRRQGLFRHVFRGRLLGSAILADLEAQVDYLVSELRGPYRQVDAALRSPGVTLEQASDVVLLRFERPASVLNRPRTDPGVQSVLRRRRGYGARALEIYRATRTNQLPRGM
jgi:Phage tail lysozyme